MTALDEDYNLFRHYNEIDAVGQIPDVDSLDCAYKPQIAQYPLFDETTELQHEILTLQQQVTDVSEHRDRAEHNLRVLRNKYEMLMKMYDLVVDRLETSVNKRRDLEACLRREQPKKAAKRRRRLFGEAPGTPTFDEACGQPE